MFQIITNNSFTFARHFEIVRFLAHRFENYLEHIFISRYVVVGCVINAIAGIEFFVIDEAKYFISYPLPLDVYKRQVCGITRPTHPIVPDRQTQLAVISVEQRINIPRVVRRLIPSDLASLSPSESTLSR